MLILSVHCLIVDVHIFENFNLTEIVTPINPDKFKQLLVETGYNRSKTKEIITGFREGFPLGYQDMKTGIQQRAPNLKLRVGNEVELWNRVMKEVQLKRYAGPFAKVPFENFIQSPIGLVPKDSGKNTRLIFHLSFPRDGQSVNSETPREWCSVKYPEFDDAIKCILKEQQLVDEDEPIVVANTDLTSVFHFVPD